LNLSEAYTHKTWRRVIPNLKASHSKFGFGILQQIWMACQHKLREKKKTTYFIANEVMKADNDMMIYW